MPKYRKKPVVVEAMQWTGENYQEVCDWAKELGSARDIMLDVKTGSLAITTLEGVMTASSNDYIICGVSGEVYPCKPDIFWLTYESVDTCPVCDHPTTEGRVESECACDGCFRPNKAVRC